MDNYKIILHIGMQRTGSTFLQKEIFPKMDINFIKLEHKLFSLFKNIEKYDKKVIYTAIENMLQSNKINLLSQENIWWYISLDNAKGDKYKRIRKIGKIFPKAKIIFGVRNKEDLLLSWYKRYILSGGILTFQQYQRKINIDDIDYDDYIIRLFELFGEENVYVYRYENLRGDTNLFVRNLSSFIGVKCPEFKNIKHNIGLSLWQLKISRLINHLFKNQLNPNGLILLNYTKFPHRKLFQSSKFPECLRGKAVTMQNVK